jgi:hypothetical protein
MLLQDEYKTSRTARYRPAKKVVTSYLHHVNWYTTTVLDLGVLK